MSPAASSKKILNIFNKFYLVVLAVIVVVIMAGGYYFVIQERVAEIQKIGTVDLDSKLNTKNIAQKNLDKLIALNDSYSQVSQYELKKLEKVLPTRSEIPFLLIEIDRFVNENGLTLKSLNIGPLSGADIVEDPVFDGAVKELNITLTIAEIESYFELKNFLAVMSDQLPLIEMSSLNYNEDLTQYSLNLTTYYQ